VINVDSYFFTGSVFFGFAALGRLSDRWNGGFRMHVQLVHVRRNLEIIIKPFIRAKEDREAE
jgi:hypothetical protein